MTTKILWFYFGFQPRGFLKPIKKKKGGGGGGGGGESRHAFTHTKQWLVTKHKNMTVHGVRFWLTSGMHNDSMSLMQCSDDCNLSHLITSEKGISCPQ